MDTTESKPSITRAKSVAVISTFISTIAFKLPESFWKEAILLCAAPLGYIVNFCWKFAESRIDLWYCESKLGGYIVELETAKKKPGLTRAEIKAIDADIATYRNSIKKKRHKHLNLS